PTPFEVRQANGSAVTLTNHGDEFFNWQEDEGGYIVAYDQSSANWCYAAVEGGELVPGAEAVGASKFTRAARLRGEDLAPLIENADRSAGTELPVPYVPPASAAGMPSSSVDGVPAVTQSKNRQTLLVLLVEYSNQKFQTTYGDVNTHWSKHYFDDTPGVKSVNNYYKEVSGAFNLQYIKPTFTWTGSTTSGLPSGVSSLTIKDGVARVCLTKSHPDTNTSNNSDAVKADLIIAFNGVKSYINFSGVPRSGGYIYSDCFTISAVVAGYDAAAGNYGNSIWGHANYSWLPKDLQAAQTGTPMRYLSIKNAGGAVSAMELLSYASQGELYRNTSTPMPVGVTVHELGHILGLPDLYCYDHMPTPRQGISYYSVMASGSWGTDNMPGSADTKDGNTPTHPDPWSKIRLGFASVTTVAPAAYTKTNLNSIAGSYNVLKVTPGSGTQYFLVENRQITGYDRGLYGATGSAQGGVLIWHVDEAPFDVYDNRGTTSQSRGNDNNGHRGFDLEGLWSSITATSASNPFYAAGGIFNATSTPNSNFHTAGHSTNPFTHKDCHPQTVASNVQLRIGSASGSVMEVASGPFVPVTGITGGPAAMDMGTPLALTAAVAPSNATFQTIVWSVVSAGTTGAAITGSTLNAAAPGSVTVRATIVNGQDLGAAYTKDFTITVNSATYGIALDKSGTQTFPAAAYGYGAQTPVAVAVSNTGTGATGALSLTLSGANPGSFECSPASLAGIPAGSGKGTFTVAPKAGLNPGTYTATVTVTGANGIPPGTAGFGVSFTVIPSAARDILAMRSPGGAAVNGTSVTASVAYAVGSLTVDPALSPGASWKLYSDAACTNEVTSKAMNLAVGANTAYIKVTAQNGADTKVYTLTVTRQADPKKYIFSTKWEATFWNWLMFFVLFGFIWMWFINP
ncbi:MAG: cadherin-like beta sandwich domain-containing protein, partial [Firmicutes bacterium]|nr:cadherin-like beta sandwich domain-containing protein [Bacillota bacterium]